jgi:HSP20 family molecular chaperone IbpA
MKKNDEGVNPFNFKDLDELIEKFFGNIGNLPNIGEGNPKTHHHSITYRFGTGMSKPEIRLNGEKVDDETMSNFLGNLGPNIKITPNRINLGSDKGITELDVKNLSLAKNPDIPSVQYENTYYELDKDGDTQILTIELPSVEQDGIIITQSKNFVTVIGESDYARYKVEFEIDFTIDKTKTEIEGNNSIYQIRLSK